MLLFFKYLVSKFLCQFNSPGNILYNSHHRPIWHFNQGLIYRPVMYVFIYVCICWVSYVVSVQRLKITHFTGDCHQIDGIKIQHYMYFHKPK